MAFYGIGKMRLWCHWIVCGAFALMVAVFSPLPTRAADCALRATLTLTDTQDGFAGTTGNVWTIHSDCTFTVSRILNTSVSAPHLRGRLTPEQQARLSAVLAEMSVATLPPRIGEPANVNPRQISLDYDGKISILELGPGTSDIAAVKALSFAHPARRLYETSVAVKGLLGAAE
jgi:hypothetical protein